MARKTLKDFTDDECVEAYRLNQRGEGPAYISGYGSTCSYRTADAMISKGERIVKKRNEDALNDPNYVVSRHHY